MLGRSLLCFPVVGSLIGLFLAGVYGMLMLLRINSISAALITVVVLAVVTGALHLDGLSDTFDALMSRKDKQAMLDIMRDPHAGAIGVVAIVALLMLKVALILVMKPTAVPAALVLMCLISRWALVPEMSLFPYARDEGKARSFIDGSTWPIALAATAIAVVISVLTVNLSGLVVISAASVFAYGFGKAIMKMLGGITGDTLGALAEMTEVITLITLFVMQVIGL